MAYSIPSSTLQALNTAYQNKIREMGVPYLAYNNPVLLGLYQQYLGMDADAALRASAAVSDWFHQHPGATTIDLGTQMSVVTGAANAGQPPPTTGPAPTPATPDPTPSPTQSTGPAIAPAATNPINPLYSGTIAEQPGPGGSVAAQVIALVNQRAASGLPIDQAWSRSVWKAAGLTDEQAAAIDSFGHEYPAQHGGAALGEGDLNDVIGQVKAGQTINPGAWRSATSAKPDAPGGPSAQDAPAVPGAPAAPAGPGATGVMNPNHFIGTDSATHLNDLINNNKGDFSVLAERLLKNQEAAQGGRFAAPIRSTYGDKAQQLEGLLNLEAVNDPTFTDKGTAAATAFNQDLGAGNKYDQPGHGLGKSLLTTAITGGNPTSQAFLKGDPAAQLKALKSALEIDSAAGLQGQIDQQADETYKDWLGQHASDPTAASAFGSFLEYAKAKNLF